MKIYSTTQKPINFGTNERVVRQGGKLVLRNCTRLFREDLDWNKISEILTAKVQRPKIYCYACSDGSEAYSIKFSLIKKLGNKKGLECRVEARDIDEQMVKSAQSGIISLSDRDFCTGKIFMGESILRFFTPFSADCTYTINDKLKYYSHKISGRKLKEIFSSVKKEKLKDFFKKYRITQRTREYKVSDRIRSGINFITGNIINDADNIDYNNTVIFFRNVWPYLKDKDVEKLLNIFKNKFTDKTFLVLGYFDKKPKIINTNLNLPEKLERIGLKEIYPKIYTKS